MKFSRLDSIACIGILLGGSGLTITPVYGQEASGATGPDFEREVRPLLAASCFSCHGPDKQRARLRLDRRAAAMAASRFEDGKILAPGDPQGSILFQRIVAEDEVDRMPPEGPPLSAVQVDLLRRWIEAGAEWPESERTEAERSQPSHWAYRAPQEPAVPTVADESWVRNEIDAFSLRHMREHGFQPSPEAARSSLIRRASIALTGLPPTLEEWEALESDRSQNAYERWIDRLLASPHYGEKQAQLWLDLARYADTHGYEKDQSRTMWRYRDWVIAAYNQDLPYDRFTLEQLAGDLLPEPSLDQRIATGFHRNTMINEEGGIDAEEFRVAAVVDRVNTTATVWMGTTLACAQCHDHKYDPFSQREYYQLYAFFNGTADSGSGSAPTLSAPTRKQSVRLQALEPEIERLQTFLAEFGPELESELVEWEETTVEGLPRWATIHPVAVEAEQGSTLTIEADGAVFASGKAPAQEGYLVRGRSPLSVITGLRVEALADERLPSHGPGRTSHGNFVLSELELELVEANGAVRKIALRNGRADHEQVDRPWKAAHIIDGQAGTGWAVAPQYGQSHQAWFELEEPLEVAPTSELRFKLDFRYGSQHIIGRLRLAVTADSLPEAQDPLPPRIEARLRDSSPRNEEDQRALEQWFLKVAPSREDERRELARLQSELPKPATVMVMGERDSMRETHVMLRGSFLQRGEGVTAEVPAVLNPFPPETPRNRLGLARWLTSAEHPLTARVAVNRIWEQHFGVGLVETSDDFGTQGSPPSHPALLDWLATELMRRNWSLKAIHRLILTSATYRQSAHMNRDTREQDPYNRHLSRGPRFRVPAETVRDIALTASGLLSRKIGGPSVFPPQPDGIWAMAYSGERWMTAEDEDRYRRGIYTFWRRTAPYPSFVTFDAPSRELVCTRRPRTNTPLQALTLLNDPAFVEAARALGRGMWLAGPKLASRLRHGVRACLSRDPEAHELEVLGDLYRSELEHYRRHGEAAQALLALDQEAEAPSSLRFSPEQRAEWAALTVVANVLLNLDETVTQG